jgi:hypothetical protein
MPGETTEEYFGIAKKLNSRLKEIGGLSFKWADLHPLFQIIGAIYFIYCTMTIPETIHIFRMVHWQNVEYILHNGICCQNHIKADPNYINIGHSKLIGDRHDHPVQIPNGGALGDYIPFYFAGHSPMLLMIKNGTGPVEKKPQEDIVFLISTFDKIQQAGLEFVFTDMNAKLKVAHYYNEKKDFSKLNWEIIQSKYWSNLENNLSSKDYKQAEFLIRDFMPINCLTHIAVLNEVRKQYFDEMIAKLALNIVVGIDNRRNLYY